jgi:sarcosine oxidase subunit beta
MTKVAIPHYDVIIIGAGSIGTPTAFLLAKAGLRTLVIDQFASIGQGSNKRAIGGIRATHSDPAKIRLCLRSMDIFSTWKEQYGDNIEWLKGGYSFVAYRQQEKQTLKELLIKQKEFDLNINWLDKNSLMELIPNLNPIDLLGGTYAPDDGNASPLLAIHAFYTHAKKLGCDFHFNERVTEIIIKSGKIKGVRTDQGLYGADVVINAAGPWAAPVSRLADIDIPVFPEAHESGITEPVEKFLKPMVVDIRPGEGSSNLYFYQHYTGQIVFCMTPSPSVWGYDHEETSSFLPTIARRLVDLMPCLASIRVRRTWRGLYPMTPDGTPLVGWIKEVTGYMLAVGMCGQGFMLGPGIGELLTRMITNQFSQKDIEVIEYLSPYRQFAGQEKLK